MQLTEREETPALLDRVNHRVLPVNKSAGVSTYDCIRRFKRFFRIRRIGHAGSLDPPARGLILLLTGEGTKLSNYLMDLPKRYIGDIKLGVSTDTQDANGQVVRTGDWRHVDEGRIRLLLPQFLGRRKQIPPMFSALKHQGKPLYMLARKGQRIERRPRVVEIYEITLHSCELPVFRIEVFCSRGLYIRVLAEELGEALGVPAHLFRLMRTEIGHFNLDDAVPDTSFDRLRDIPAPGYTLSDALAHLPAIQLSESETLALRNGRPPHIVEGLPDRGSYARLITPDGRLGAIAEVGPAGYLGIKRVFTYDDVGGNRP